MSTFKKALVTGASEGIGREFAIQLAKAGYEVTAVARNEERLKSLMKEIQAKEPSYLVSDLSDLLQVQTLCHHLEKNHYDLLVNNAGYGVYGTFSNLPLEKLQNMTRLNCDALVMLSHAFLKNGKKGDALINVASVLGFVAMPLGGLYSATKAFVLSLSESLWFQERARGIYVMVLCPGSTATHFHERAGGTEEQAPPKIILQTPAQVVSTAMKALAKRKQHTVVPGAQNLMLLGLARIIPRNWMIQLMGNARN